MKYKEKIISTHASLFQIGTEKDYSLIESSLGFAVSQGTTGTCAITPIEAAKFVAVLEFKAGIARGNHYHKAKVEYMCVLNGQLNCKLYPIDAPSASHNLILTAGQILKIAPNCVHTFTAIGTNVFALEYSPQKFEQSDVIVIEE